MNMLYPHGVCEDGNHSNKGFSSLNVSSLNLRGKAGSPKSSVQRGLQQMTITAFYVSHKWRVRFLKTLCDWEII